MIEFRRYDMTNDQNNPVAWKMTRTPEGQYVPFIDVEKLKKERDDLAEECERLRVEYHNLASKG